MRFARVAGNTKFVEATGKASRRAFAQAAANEIAHFELYGTATAADPAPSLNKHERRG
jgi:hypothetical protein